MFIVQRLGGERALLRAALRLAFFFAVFYPPEGLAEARHPRIVRELMLHIVTMTRNATRIVTRCEVSL